MCVHVLNPIFVLMHMIAKQQSRNNNMIDLTHDDEIIL